MGSLRHMPKETPIKAKPQPLSLKRIDIEPHLRLIEPILKHNFLINVIEDLRRDGPGPLITHANPRRYRSSTNVVCDVLVETLCEWYDDFVEDGSICGDSGIFWLPEQTPPKNDIITVYSYLPREKAKAITAVTLATQSGLCVESVEIAMKEILDEYDWMVAETRHRPPRYYRDF